MSELRCLSIQSLSHAYDVHFPVFESYWEVFFATFFPGSSSNLAVSVSSDCQHVVLANRSLDLIAGRSPSGWGHGHRCICLLDVSVHVRVMPCPRRANWRGVNHGSDRQYLQVLFEPRPAYQYHFLSARWDFGRPRPPPPPWLESGAYQSTSLSCNFLARGAFRWDPDRSDLE